MPSSLEADEANGCYVLCRLPWRRMESRAISFLHDGSYGCGSPIVWLVGRIQISLVHAVLIRT